ncbi:DEAD/DEAH box helicase family protein [Burkholderia vietnamiensis]|uniref:DEAD/DEAH box helicase family protein n=1 Tax=Burkholderia vietnamiensis TaxID=60552 RepID=UPI001CF45A14|nr:DEAD/DEAH box helicase family protein [Burkholderia vietnamiensis]MCA7986588.1 DEAD/DEAH box helicase family protein [Burkholderia vietnamiensis]
MKLKFKTQSYQTAAVQTVVDCFKGQPPASAEATSYRIDLGKSKTGMDSLFTEAGFKNADLMLSDTALLDNIQQVQRQQNLPISDALVKTKVARVNLDIEMETGTGKTYCYVKTIFEMNSKRSLPTHFRRDECQGKLVSTSTNRWTPCQRTAN